MATALTTPTLTIEPGVEVKGLSASDGTFQTAAVLQINRGANIMAVGTADDPIIFSSEDADYEGPFEWGGLIVSGFGPHNTCDDEICNITAEGGAGILDRCLDQRLTITAACSNTLSSRKVVT